MVVMTSVRQLRADFDDDAITVYQAYSGAIAIPAVDSGSFVGSPFKLDRMTWIKPSFLWMMYRSGWATKPGQEHVLAIRITRAGFEEALSQACLSSFDAAVYADHASWVQLKGTSHVRIQWDPERDLALKPLPWRSLQVGLRGGALHSFVNHWIVDVVDATEFVREVHATVSAGDYDIAGAKLPNEQPYPLPDGIRATIGAD